MENTTNYNQQQYYYPPMQLRQEKKPLPAFVGPLVLFFVGLFSVIPNSTGHIVAAYTLPEYMDNWQFREHIMITSAGSLLSNIFYFLLVGLAGFFCYRGFRGSLKFTGCLLIGLYLTWFFFDILYGIGFLQGDLFILSYSTQTTIYYTIPPLLGTIFSTILLVIIDILEKKTKKNKNPITVNYDQYGNFVMFPKNKGFSVARASIVVLVTFILYIIFFLVSKFIPVNIDNSNYFYSAIYFCPAITYLITLICIVSLSFLIGKGVKNGVGLIGCYASSAFIAQALYSMINLILFSIVGVDIVESGYYNAVTIILTVIANLTGALITIGIVALIHNRKEFSEN